MEDHTKTKAELIEDMQEARRQSATLDIAQQSASVENIEYKQAKERLRALQDLSSELGAAVNLEDMLRLCVETALQYSALDSGGIYLVDELTGDLHLVYSKGVSVEFAAATSHFPADAPSTRLVMDGQTLYADYSTLKVPVDEIRRAENIRSISVIPVQHKAKSIACLNVASHSLDSVGAADRAMLETIASLTGSFIVRAQEEEKRREAEEALRENAEKNQQSQKMAAIGRLAGGVAHDFNNVLCSISGNAELALTELPTGDPLVESMMEISKAVDRASDLTRQLLAFSRKQIINPKVINLSHVIQNLHSMLVRLIGEDIVLRTVPRKQLGPVMVDPGQIEQIVLNLAVNARDAMPDGGELLIETANVVLDEDYCSTHTKMTPGDHVVLAVSDTGCGMTAEIRSKIFEPFYTTKQLGRGTGLGLATVFGIVAQNGGSIEVTSEEGKGASFRVYFPQTLEKAEALTDSKEPKPVGGNETVLVVEDAEIVLNMAVKLLSRLGYEVLASRSGTDALSLVKHYEDPIHLLLTDLVMPHMNGRELADKVMEARPGTKVLYTSGYTHDVIAHHGVLHEGIDFLAKPYSIDTLAARVRDVLNMQ